MSPFSAFGHFVTLETRWLVGFDLNTNFTLPTGNLDSRTELEVISLLKSCVNEYGQTLVMITHDETIAQMADRVLVIEDGKVVSQ